MVRSVFGGRRWVGRGGAGVVRGEGRTEGSGGGTGCRSVGEGGEQGKRSSVQYDVSSGDNGSACCMRNIAGAH